MTVYSPQNATLSLIGQVPGPFHQLRDSLLAGPLEGREVANCGLFTHFEMLTLSLIGQVPGPVHQLRDSVLTWPIGGREVAGPGPSQPVEVTSGAGPHQPTSCQVEIQYFIY
jgi:hypothetical protein